MVSLAPVVATHRRYILLGREAQESCSLDSPSSDIRQNSRFISPPVDRGLKSEVAANGYEPVQQGIPSPSKASASPTGGTPQAKR